jgi:hypothetical protein
MKASRCAAKRGSASVVLGLLSLLASCSLETTGSGDFSLGAGDDSFDGEGAQGDVGEVPGDDVADRGDDDDDDGAVATSAPGDAASETRDAGPSRADGECRPGNYQGSFTCKQPTVAAPAWASGLTGNEITGSFSFRLEPTGKANTFELIGGSLHSADNAFFKLDANITATFACGKPLRGKLTEASYTIIFGAATPFESPFDASYDKATGNFVDGTWVVKNDTLTQCNGTWTATRSSD